jgi:transmembrane sensor
LCIYNATNVVIQHQALTNYSDYKTEDFLKDDRFRKWMASGGSEDALFWGSFKEQFPDKANELALAVGIFKSLHELRAAPDVQVKREIWNNVANAFEETDAENDSATSLGLLYRWWWMAAAVLLIAGGLAWNFWFAFKGVPLGYDRQISAAGVQLRETVNNSKTEQTVLLKDGSTVRLKPGSKLSFSDFLAGKRVVYLDGEGFFDVTKDPARPFIVYAGHIVVQVVGTSFSIVSKTGMATNKVSVTSGKVKVFTTGRMDDLGNTKEENSLYLTPNQEVVYNSDTKIFDKGLVAEPVQLAKTGEPKEFYFDNTAVNEILKELETAYGVNIRLNNTAFGSCKVTAPLGGLPLFRKLDIICQTVGATYQVFGTEIVISGGSCDL